MAWSRIDRDDVLVVAKTTQQVETDVRTLGQEFQPTMPIAISEVTGDYYQWLRRRVNDEHDTTGLTTKEM